jgi:hypothetical protein
MRSAVIELGKLGPPPSSDAILANPNGDALVKKYEDLILSIKRPVTDAEARVLVGIFGPDEFFGLASTLINLIETAPNWPLSDCLMDSDNEWIAFLNQRIENAKRFKK